MSFRRQMYTPFGAGSLTQQKWCAQCFLQLPDLSAEGRLRDEQSLGCLAEIQFLGQNHEIAKLSKRDLV